jgi:NTE family protein
MERATTALVLGGGGLFGAYQAGVWKALEGSFQPDMVVGASIGALNGLAIAGGCAADEWIAQWMEMGAHGRPRLRLPRGPFDGLFDAAPVERFARRLMERFQPRVRYGVALTSVRPLRTRVFWDDEITWRHLCASCGVPLLLRQYKLNGQWWADGGLLDAVPVEAAIEAGATRIVAVNILRPRGAAGGVRASQSANSGGRPGADHRTRPGAGGVARDRRVAARADQRLDRARPERRSTGAGGGEIVPDYGLTRSPA